METTARSLFSSKGKNFLTPKLVKYRANKKAGLFIEVSRGDSLFGFGQIYGVTVLSYKGDNLHGLSSSFRSLDEAESYINLLFACFKGFGYREKTIYDSYIETNKSYETPNEYQTQGFINAELEQFEVTFYNENGKMRVYVSN